MMTYRPIPVEEVIAAMPRKRQEAIAKRGAELLAKVERRMTLAALRKGRKISQATWRRRWNRPDADSRLEKRKDPRLSTMARTIAAMGGHLTMIATFPDQEPVVLVASQFAEKTMRGRRGTDPDPPWLQKQGRGEGSQPAGQYARRRRTSRDVAGPLSQFRLI